MRRLLAAAAMCMALPASAHAARISTVDGTPADITICGTPQSAQLLDPEAVANVKVRGGGALRGKLILQECHNGKWRGRQRVGRTDGIVSQDIGDYRVRDKGRRHADPLYLRFGAGEIVDEKFSVEVENVNGTSAVCTSDGQKRTIKGHLTAARSALVAPEPAVTLYLHGFGYGEYFWRYRKIGGYDTTTALAEAGHASVTIDRPGYGRSKLDSDGTATCMGSQADMAHQVVDALKAGTYKVAHNDPVAFKRAALIGHSAGGLIAELAAESFKGIDGLGIISYTDQGQSPLALTQLGLQSMTCASGGAKATPGFAPFGAADQDYKGAMFNAASDQAVVADAIARRLPEPCGDVLSATAALTANTALNPTISGPVLLMIGDRDALFTSLGFQLQGEKMGGQVTSETIVAAGHAITLGLQWPTFFDALEKWLTTNNF